MHFEKEFLRNIAEGKAMGDFPPFSTGEWEKSDPYLMQLIGRIKDIKTIEVYADFDHYGSGFSSYIPLNLSKKDRCDVKVSENGNLKSFETNGLLMYLCRLAPFAIYGEGLWEATYNSGKYQSGSSHFIEPEDVGSTPPFDWSNELNQIRNLLNQFRIKFLTKDTVDQPLDFKVDIPTIFSDPPYKIFDCFFYWED